MTPEHEAEKWRRKLRALSRSNRLDSKEMIWEIHMLFALSVSHVMFDERRYKAALVAVLAWSDDMVDEEVAKP